MIGLGLPKQNHNSLWKSIDKIINQVRPAREFAGLFYTFAATKPHPLVRQAHCPSNHPEQREGQGADGAWPLTSCRLRPDLVLRTRSEGAPFNTGHSVRGSIPSLALGIFGEDTEAKPKYNFKQTPIFGSTALTIPREPSRAKSRGRPEELISKIFPDMLYSFYDQE